MKNWNATWKKSRKRTWISHISRPTLTHRKGKIRPSYSGVSRGQNTNWGMNDNTPGRNAQQKANLQLNGWERVTTVGRWDIFRWIVEVNKIAEWRPQIRANGIPTGYQPFIYKGQLSHVKNDNSKSGIRMLRNTGVSPYFLLQSSLPKGGNSVTSSRVNIKNVRRESMNILILWVNIESKVILWTIDVGIVNE